MLVQSIISTRKKHIYLARFISNSLTRENFPFLSTGGFFDKVSTFNGIFRFHKEENDLSRRSITCNKLQLGNKIVLYCILHTVLNIEMIDYIYFDPICA